MNTYRMAHVVRIDGDDAVVTVDLLTGCGHCHEAGGCGGSAREGGRGFEFHAINTIGAAAGDTVCVAIPNRGPRLAALLAYGLPVLGLLAGALLAGRAGQGDGGSALAAFLGLILGGGAGFFLARHPALRRGMRVELAPAALCQSES